MRPSTKMLDVRLTRVHRQVADFLALTRPRVVLMVLVATSMGFYLGALGKPDYLRLLHTLIGIALAAGGTLALNQFLERDVDAQMERTRLRPLPAGRLTPTAALAFGVTITAGGLLLLTLAVGVLSGLITAISAGSYLFLYTPLKQRSPLCTVVGAIPGALPPVIGWAAARGELGVGAEVLFAIVFLWQVPHALAIARLYCDDYARASIRLGSMGCPVVGSCVALLPVGLLPTLIGLTGAVYFFAALVLGVTFLGYRIGSAISPSAAAARRLLFVSLVYLPALLMVMALDKVPL